MPRHRSQNPAAEAFDAALKRLGATALEVDEEAVVVASDELELSFAWTQLQDVLGDGQPAHWADALAEFLIESAGLARAEDDTWDALRPRLLPVLLSRDGSAEMARRCPDLLAFAYAGALLVAVAYRVGPALRYLLRQHAASWAVAPEMILSSALDNLRQATPPEVIQTIEPDHYALDGGDGLDSSRLLILDELLPEAAETGLVAAAPARDMLSFAPFNGRGIKHLKTLVTVAGRGFRTWPFPLVDSLFYIAPGSAVHLAVTHDTDGKPRLRIPEELAGVQARLVADGRW